MTLPGTLFTRIRSALDSAATRGPHAPAGADLTPPLPRADSVPGQWVNATERPAVDAGVTLYAHGGGFEQRNPGFEQVMAYRLSAATGRAAWALDYRLAPAHPFPAALDDLVTAYQSLLDRGVPASRTVLFGESAGATLVLSALHVMRSQDMPRTGAPDVLCAVPGPLGGGRRPSAACGRPRVNDLDAGAVEVRQVASGKYRAAGAADGGDKSVETSDRLPRSLAGTGNNRVLLSSSCIDWQDLLIEGPEGVVRGI